MPTGARGGSAGEHQDPWLWNRTRCHSACLEPLSPARLFDATRTTLEDWTNRLRSEVGEGFPEKVTAFREFMAVHGRYGEPCPACGGPVQRIVQAQVECNYCPTCQTDGKLLADRALSRLLRGDWPRTLGELEERKNAAR